MFHSRQLSRVCPVIYPTICHSAISILVRCEREPPQNFAVLTYSWVANRCCRRRRPGAATLSPHVRSLHPAPVVERTPQVDRPHRFAVSLRPRHNVVPSQDVVVARAGVAGEHRLSVRAVASGCSHQRRLFILRPVDGAAVMCSARTTEGTVSASVLWKWARLSSVAGVGTRHDRSVKCCGYAFARAPPPLPGRGRAHRPPQSLPALPGQRLGIRAVAPKGCENVPLVRPRVPLLHERGVDVDGSRPDLGDQAAEAVAAQGLHLDAPASAAGGPR